MSQELKIVNNNKDQQPIIISVIDAQTSTGQFDSLTLYTVKGQDNNGPFDIKRRYKDFSTLRDVLIMKWPGCYVPGLPGRKLFQGNDIKIVNDRQKFLHQFCLRLSRLPHIYYSQEVSQLFLRSKDKDVYKIFEQIQKPNAVELIQKYQVNFGELQGKDIDKALIKNVDDFADKVKYNYDQLKLAKKYMRETVLSQEQLNKCVDNIMNNSVPEYEKQFVATYCNDETLLLFNNEQRKATLDKQLHSDVIFKRIHLWMFLDLIRLEMKDCKALLHQLKVRGEYEDYKKKQEQKAKELQIDYQNALQGKTGVMAMIKQTSNEDVKTQIQSQIALTQNEIENTKVLIDIIYAVIGYIEVERYQKDQQQIYEQVLQELQQIEQQTIQEQTQYWQYINEQTKQLLNQIKVTPQVIEQKQQQQIEKPEITKQIVEVKVEQKEEVLQVEQVEQQVDEEQQVEIKQSDKQSDDQL